jgi:uncharacterized membrane protein YqaE (UPF0057 family)
MLKIIVHGFLSGLGFLLAALAIAAVIAHPILLCKLAFIPAVLFAVYWQRRRGDDVRRGLTALRALKRD